jgi:hypothetical protein
VPRRTGFVSALPVLRNDTFETHRFRSLVSQSLRIDAVLRKKIKGVQPDFSVTLAPMQGVKVGYPVRPEHDGFTVKNE